MLFILADVDPTVHPPLWLKAMSVMALIVLARFVKRLVSGYYDQPRASRERVGCFQSFPLRSDQYDHFGYRLSRRVERMERREKYRSGEHL